MQSQYQNTLLRFWPALLGFALVYALWPLLLNQGWQFIEQMGAGHFFEKDGRRAVATCEMFSRHFSVCSVSQI